MAAPFKISAAILCDERRTENNGKHILIGVYISSILLNDFPANLAVTLWIEALPLALGKQTGQVRIIKNDGAILAKGEIQSTVVKIGPAVLEMAKIPLALQSEGTLQFQWKFNEADEWETIKEVTVRKGLTTSPSPQPPSSQSQPASS